MNNLTACVNSFTVGRSPEPIQIFVVDSDGGNIEELLGWCEGTLSAISIVPGGKPGSRVYGPDISVYYHDPSHERRVKKVVGLSAGPRGKDWYSFQKDFGAEPTAVLVKRVNRKENTASVIPEYVSDLRRQGYDL